MRESAKKFIEEGKFEEALEQYNECLKILPQSEVLDYLSVLQNRLVCYLRLERLDDIVSTCIRGLKIIRVHRDRIVSFDEAKVSKSQQETLVELEVRFLFRRANAYFKLGQFYNCRSDIEEALALSPADPIKAELMKIRSQLV
jgi:tetratricopeptide (TPR) repeat protein